MYKKHEHFVLLPLLLLLIFLIPTMFIAIFCAYILYPFVAFIHKKTRLPFAICAILLSAAIFGLIGYSIFYISSSLFHLTPHIYSAFQQFHSLEEVPPFLDTLFQQSVSYLDTIASYLTEVTQIVFHYILQFLIGLMAFYFSLFESKKNRLWFFMYVPKSTRKIWSHYFTKAMNIFSYFMIVELQLFTLTFILLSLGFFTLQFDMPVKKALIIALADFLPFLGIGLFLIPVAIYFAVLKQYMLTSAIMLLYIFVLLSRQLFESKLWASNFQVRAIHSFFISASAILIFGVYGIFISPFLLLFAVKIRQRYF